MKEEKQGWKGKEGRKNGQKDMRKADTQEHVKEYMEKDYIREAGKGRLHQGSREVHKGKNAKRRPVRGSE
jgi:hypothetical protein